MWRDHERVVPYQRNHKTLKKRQMNIKNTIMKYINDICKFVLFLFLLYNLSACNESIIEKNKNVECRLYWIGDSYPEKVESIAPDAFRIIKFHYLIINNTSDTYFLPIRNNRVAIDNETIKGESTLNGALAVRYGTSLTKTASGLEVKVDGTTITKNSSGALVATPASSAVRIDGSTLKRDSNNTMYVDIDNVSLKLFSQGDGRTAIGVNLDNTTIGLNENGALCALNSGGGGGGGGSIAVDGTTIQNGVNGLYANLDQQTLVVNQDSHISTNIEGRYDSNGSIFRAFGHAKPYEAGQRYYMGELIYTRASETSGINAVYIARATITADGNINTDIAAGYIGLIVSF
jgi:hypothetical protein